MIMHIVPKVIKCIEGLHNVFNIMKYCDARTKPIMESVRGGGHEPIIIP
jgi:hypothetical protein